jgi:hypothetical protein
MIVPFSKDKMIQIGELIEQGMSEEEACILVDVRYISLLDAMNEDEGVKSYIDKKKVKFKRNHIEIIGEKKSDKTSQWLLEKLRPDEFGPRHKATNETTVNIISQIIQEIQNDNQPIVRITRGETREVPEGEPFTAINALN